MSNINNIPQNMIDEHINWHTKPGNPGGGGRAINPWPGGSSSPAPGSGEEFLVWHRGYVDRFHDWVGNLPARQKPNASSITPWTSIPMGLKMGMVGWNSSRAADEAQLADMSNFSTLDELGGFLEWGLHGWLHGASAQMWSEPVLTSFESPRSTFFWQLHGLIDHWRQQWVDESKPKINPDLLELIKNLRWVKWPVPPIPRPEPDPWFKLKTQIKQPEIEPIDRLTSEEVNLIQNLRAFKNR